MEQNYLGLGDGGLGAVGGFGGLSVYTCLGGEGLGGLGLIGE